jgi:hypothetical protein
MSKFDDFLARFPGYLDEVTKYELRLFFETTEDLSDEYEAQISRLRTMGKFKSIFGNSRATNARRTTNMTNTTDLLTPKEKAEYPRDLYKTLIGMAKDGKKPSGLTAAISGLLARENPGFEMGSDHTLLVPLEALLSRKALQVTSAPAGGFLVSNDVGRQIEGIFVEKCCALLCGFEPRRLRIFFLPMYWSGS